MTKPVLRRVALAALGSVLLAGCRHRAAPEPLSPDVLWQRAHQALDAHRNGRAATLFGQFLALAPGDPRVAEATYLTGRAHVGAREYVTAASDFLRVVNEFPSDTLARHARMGLCEAYVKLSPNPQLDQEYTSTAVAYCESYAEIFPNTPQADRARRYVGELNEKLALKEYQTGLFYFRRRAYDASVIYFNRAVADYPRTAVAAAALLKLVQAYGAVGYVEERDAARARLLRDYPQSPEAKSLAG
jgi:outer membrane protein assembly factor BamD